VPPLGKGWFLSAFSLCGKPPKRPASYLPLSQPKGLRITLPIAEVHRLTPNPENKTPPACKTPKQMQAPLQCAQESLPGKQGHRSTLCDSEAEDTPIFLLF